MKILSTGQVLLTGKNKLFVKSIPIFVIDITGFIQLHVHTGSLAPQTTTVLNKNAVTYAYCGRYLPPVTICRQEYSLLEEIILTAVNHRAMLSVLFFQQAPNISSFVSSNVLLKISSSIFLVIYKSWTKQPTFFSYRCQNQ